MNMNQFTQKSLAAIQGLRTSPRPTATSRSGRDPPRWARARRAEAYSPAPHRHGWRRCAPGGPPPTKKTSRRRAAGGSRRRTRSMWPRTWTGPSRPPGVQAQSMKDEYISVEHLLLGLLERPTAP